jgi:hypothetical protein
MSGFIKYVGNIARLDVMREDRTRIPEVIFAKNKEPEDVARLLLELASENNHALATKVKKEDVEELRKVLPDGYEMEFNERARTIVVKKTDLHFRKREDKGEKVGVLTAGTSDIPVAEEVCVTLEVMGCETINAYDVGIAGIHRVFDPLEKMLQNGVCAIVVVAGMEGSLPSVVSGLVDVPVIGVPTSGGYGVGGDGTAALFTMLQSCSPGLAVVNIDNGFGAGAFAGLISQASVRAGNSVSQL